MQCKHANLWIVWTTVRCYEFQVTNPMYTTGLGRPIAISNQDRLTFTPRREPIIHA